MKNRSHKKSRDYWVATNFNENLFNEIAPKMHIFRATHIGVTYVFNIVASEGGHKIFDHQIGGHKNIAEVLSEIHDPTIPKKMVAPNLHYTTR